MATGAGPVDGEWASFVAAPPPVRRVAEDWLAGLARNPAAPAALLVRLLDTDAFLHVLYRPDLPPKVVDAASGIRPRSGGTSWRPSCWRPGNENEAVRAMPDWRWRQFMTMWTRSASDAQRRPDYREPEPRQELRPPGVPDRSRPPRARPAGARADPAADHRLEARHRPHKVTVAAARNPAIPAAVMDHMASAAITALAAQRGDA